MKPITSATMFMSDNLMDPVARMGVRPNGKLFYYTVGGILYELDETQVAVLDRYRFKIRMTRELSGEAPPQSKLVGTVPCPCTLIEQDEDCPVGYPSMVCGVCKGIGNTTPEQVTALACEMIKIASDMGEPKDPFAAWETIDLIKSQHGQLRKALNLAVDHIEHMAGAFSNKGTGYSFEALGEDLPGIKAALATEGQP